MNQREAALFELRHEKYLIAAYSPLCRAAGFDCTAMQGGDCYFLATAIMGALRDRARAIVRGVFSETDYLGALRSMTAAELSGVRARINYRAVRKP
jgi:hypothetical protein